MLPWLATPARLGAAAARIVLAGFGLGALWVATGTLDVAGLVSWAAREGNLQFTSLTLGMVIGGVLLPHELPRRWQAWLPGLPLALGVTVVLAQVGVWSAVGLGAALGMAPMLVARTVRHLRPARPRQGHDLPAPSRLGPAARVVGAGVLTVAVLAGPLVVVTTGLAGVMLAAGWAARKGGGGRRWPVAAVVGALGLAAFTWLALTIAGVPLVAMRGYALDAPVSPAAEQLLTTFLLVGLLGAFAPWPLHRLGDARPGLPIAVALAHAAAMMIVPDGIRAWLPLVTMVLVPLGVVAVARQQWDGAAGALAALAAVRPGPVALAGALAVVTWPVVLSLRPAGRGNPHPGERVTFPGVRLGVMIAAGGTALVVASVLADEAVLGTALAAGLASAAPLADRPQGVPATDRPPIHET